MAECIDETCTELFDAEIFVRSTLTIPPHLRGATRHSMLVNILASQVLEGIEYCEAYVNRDSSPDSEYFVALSHLGRRLGELKEKYPLAFTRSNGKEDKSLPAKPYSAQNGFGVVNLDGIIRLRYLKEDMDR